MKSSPLSRLLAPRSVALVGGTWADAVANASRIIGYTGEIWRVHPKRTSSSETTYYRSIDELPGVPDAAFVAAPNVEVPAIAAALMRRGAGGFVCFAAGFSETAKLEGDRLTGELLASAGELPFFGPNCYGFINFFDGVALWPDQVVGRRRERGVALICQSGTIALNLLFNRRSVPIGYVLTVGNQTRLAVEDMIDLLAEDERVTAFGLYVEGIKDAGRFARAVEKARIAGKPVAIVKAGRTEAAARTARSHTGSLAGADVVFDAFCQQAGVARCESLATLCETLKVLHAGGPLRGRRVMVLGASGGDMAMTADAARDLRLEFAGIPDESIERLREILADKVHIANPFDFHTHIWFDRPALRSMFAVVQRSGFDAVGFMVDCPPASAADPATYIATIEEFIAAFPGAATRGAIISSLPESLAEETREMCLAAGIVPLQGQRQALEALDLAAEIGEAWAGGAHVELRVPHGSDDVASTALGNTASTTQPGARAPENSGSHNDAIFASDGGPSSPLQYEAVRQQPERASVPIRAGADVSANSALQKVHRAGSTASTRAAPKASLNCDAVRGYTPQSFRGDTLPPDHDPGVAGRGLRSLAEHEGKLALAAFGVKVPRSHLTSPGEAADAAVEIGFPVVMKVASTELEHKSDVGGVVVNIRNREEAKSAAQRLGRLADTLLVEEMIADGVAEVLIGMTVDPQFGQVLVIGAGGVLTELLRDTVSLLPPFTPSAIEAALKRLAVYKLLTGYRGRPAADIAALVETAMACARYAEANVDSLMELDINPVIVRPAGRGAIAVDALIRLADAHAR
jgi:acetate---CoA ligase (ADP-forming)